MREPNVPCNRMFPREGFTELSVCCGDLRCAHCAEIEKLRHAIGEQPTWRACPPQRCQNTYTEPCRRDAGHAGPCDFRSNNDVRMAQKRRKDREERHYNGETNLETEQRVARNYEALVEDYKTQLAEAERKARSSENYIKGLLGQLNAPPAPCPLFDPASPNMASLRMCRRARHHEGCCDFGTEDEAGKLTQRLLNSQRDTTKNLRAQVKEFDAVRMRDLQRIIIAESYLRAISNLAWTPRRAVRLARAALKETRS